MPFSIRRRHKGYIDPLRAVPLPANATRVDGRATRERVMDFILEYKRAHDGISPTVREIGEACEISSTSVVNYHLLVLERAGSIVREYAGQRGIRVTGGIWMLEKDLEARLEAERNETIRVLRQPA